MLSDFQAQGDKDFPGTHRYFTRDASIRLQLWINQGVHKVRHIISCAMESLLVSEI
jgi:hypothetical protein